MNDKIISTQRDANNNQSTVDYERRHIFLFGNRYGKVEITASADVALPIGTVITNEGAFGFTSEADNEIDGIIGVVSHAVEILNGNTAEVNYCLSGELDQNLLILTGASSLQSTGASGKTIEQVLNALGFVLFDVTENSKFDN